MESWSLKSKIDLDPGTCINNSTKNGFTIDKCLSGIALSDLIIRLSCIIKSTGKESFNSNKHSDLTKAHHVICDFTLGLANQKASK